MPWRKIKKGRGKACVSMCVCFYTCVFMEDGEESLIENVTLGGTPEGSKKVSRACVAWERASQAKGVQWEGISLGSRTAGRPTCPERHERGAEVSGVSRDRAFRVLKATVTSWALL